MLGIETLLALAYSYWYLGVFAIGVITSAVLFLPTPAFLVFFFLAKTFDPFLLGFVAGFGSAIGELTGYFTGVISEKVVLKRYESKLKDIEKKFEKHHPSITIFLFAALPLPFDIVGIFCGLIHYKLRHFMPPLLVGKFVKYWIISYAGYYGLTWVQSFGFW